MSHLVPIYDVWGGNAEAMAGDIGELGVTVRQWRNRGLIPVRYWPKIIAAAARRGEVLSVNQFVDLPPESTGDGADHASGITAPACAPSPDIAGADIGAASCSSEGAAASDGGPSGRAPVLPDSGLLTGPLRAVAGGAGVSVSDGDAL